MDDPQGPAPAIKMDQESVVGMQTTTTTPAIPSGNPKPLDLESSSPSPQSQSHSQSPAQPALSDKPSPAVSAPRQELLEIDMEPVPEQQIRRQDTQDSFQSNFASRRTNTIWSVLSTTTDITEVTEPDLATIHDEDEEHDASPPSRSFTSPCRSNTFSSPPPSRTQSFNVVNDETMGPTPSAAHLDIRPLTHPEVLRLRETSSGSRNPNRPGRGPSHPVSIPIRQKAPENAGPGPRSTLGREDSSATVVPSDTPPRETSEAAEATESHTEPEWTHSDPEDWAMDALQRPDENLIQDVCDRILKQVFGVELQDLVDTGAAPEAYRSVSYCLDELSRITSASNVASFNPPIHELGNGQQQSHTPIRPNHSGGSDQNGQGNNGNSRRPGKRGPSDNGDSPEQDGSNGGDDYNNGGPSGKKARIDEADQRLSCPFRKRNPVKFNVRDHQNCAVQSFPDVSQLKRHVKIFHKQKAVSAFDCPRCKKNMGAKETLQEHLAVDNGQICDFQETPSSLDPEDGINAKIEDLLNGRRANSKVDTWDILWQTLFPDDPQHLIPDPCFVPPVELDEVLDFHAQQCREDLKKRIAEEELSGSSGSEEDIHEHIERVFNICDNYIANVFRECREVKIGNLPGQTRRKRTQKPRAPRGQKDPSRLDIPVPGHPSFVSENGDPGSASDIDNMDTPRSNQSNPWAAYGTQGGISAASLAQVSPAVGPLPADSLFEPFGVGGIGVSGPNSQVIMTQPEQLLGFPSQPQPHHRKTSGDSGVAFNFGTQQRHHGFAAHPQMSAAPMGYHNPGPNFMAAQGMPPQGMPPNGRGQPQPAFHMPMTIQTSMPLTMAGTTSTGMDATLLGNHHSPLDQNGYYSPDGNGLNNMGNGNGYM